MPPPPPKPDPPRYGRVRPSDGRGQRICCWALPPELADQVEAALRQLGIQPTDTSRFLTESVTH